MRLFAAKKSQHILSECTLSPHDETGIALIHSIDGARATKKPVLPVQNRLTEQVNPNPNPNEIIK